MQALKEEILKQYEAGKYEMPSLDEILENKKDKVNTRHIIEAMEGQELTRLNHQYYISKAALLEARAKMEQYIAENGQITLAEFRDMLETSRKYAVSSSGRDAAPSRPASSSPPSSRSAAAASTSRSRRTRAFIFIPRRNGTSQTRR